MNTDFIAERIAQLRIAKGVSARDMSLTIGQADNYINHIENKKSLPSISSFFYICEYLKVTPHEFFDEGNRNPKELNDLVSKMKKLNDQSLSHITGIVDELLRKK
jgi:transcriptional regulator with XRE-family HTH domain